MKNENLHMNYFDFSAHKAKYIHPFIRAHPEGTGPPGLRGSPLTEHLKKPDKSLTLKKNQRMRKIKNSCFATG